MTTWCWCEALLLWKEKGQLEVGQEVVKHWATVDRRFYTFVKEAFITGSCLCMYNVMFCYDKCTIHILPPTIPVTPKAIHGALHNGIANQPLLLLLCFPRHPRPAL